MQWNGRSIQSAEDFAAAVDASGVEATLLIQNTQNIHKEVKVTLNKAGGSPASAASSQPSTSSQGPVFGASVQGNQVVNVVPGSPAANVGLEVNDRILKFNNQTINTAEDFSRAVDESPRTASLVVMDHRTNQEKNVVIQLNK